MNEPSKKLPPFNPRRKIKPTLTSDVLSVIFKFLPFSQLRQLLHSSSIELKHGAIKALNLFYGLQISQDMTVSQRQDRLEEYNFATSHRQTVAHALVNKGTINSLKEAKEAVKGLYTWQTTAIEKSYHLGLRRQHIIKLQVEDFCGLNIDIGCEHANAIERLIKNYKQTPEKAITVLSKIQPANVAYLFILINEQGLSVQDAAAQLSNLTGYQGQAIRTLYPLGLRHHHLLELETQNTQKLGFHQTSYNALSDLMKKGLVSPEKAINILKKITTYQVGLMLELAMQQSLKVEELVSEFENLTNNQALALLKAYPLGLRRQHILDFVALEPKKNDFNDKHVKFLSKLMNKITLGPLELLEIIDAYPDYQLETILLLVGEQKEKLEEVLAEVKHLSHWQCHALNQGYAHGLRQHHLLSWLPPAKDGMHCQYNASHAASTSTLMTFFHQSPSKTIELQGKLQPYELTEVMKLAKQKQISIDEAYEQHLKRYDDIDLEGDIFSQLK